MSAPSQPTPCQHHDHSHGDACALDPTELGLPTGVVVRTEEVEQDDVRWSVDPDWRNALLGSEGDAGAFDPAGWVAAGEATVVKQGPARTVYHVRRAGRAFYLKQFKIASLSARLRAWWGSKAEKEARHLRRMAELAIPSIKLVAVGHGANGETWLATKSIEGAESLTEYLERRQFALQPAEARALAEQMAELVSRMHANGIHHRDFHPGNVLIRTGGQRPLLFLIDLHDLSMGRPLVGLRAMRNLTQLNLYFSQHVSRTARRRFFREYCRRRPNLGWNESDIARRLETITEEWCLRFWEKRDRRAESNNKYFYNLNAGQAYGFATRDLPTDVFREVLDDPESWLQQHEAETVKESRRSTVWRVTVPLSSGDVTAYVKRYAAGSGLGAFSPLVRLPRALRAWRLMNQLVVRGLPTARPLAVIEAARWGRERAGYVMAAEIPNAKTLYDWLHDELIPSLGTQPATPSDSPNAARRRMRVAEQLARWVRRLHDLGFSHRDLKTPNILIVGDDDEVSFIDVDGLQFGRSINGERRRRDLTRLSAAVASAAGVSHGVRLKFLKTYLGRDGIRDDEWKTWWWDLAAGTERKLERNERVGRPIA